ncbi:type IV secretory system conjugative DNA transfer family protein [Acinetobacter junii]|nr:type IV secretory system conjugative DNA transfer family protein [Acinetobacter junii]
MKRNYLTVALLFSAFGNFAYAAPATQADQDVVQVDVGTPIALDPLNLNKKGDKQASNAEVEIKSSSLDDLMNPTSKATTGVTDIRTEMLQTAARTVGFQNGLADAARVYIKELESRQEKLTQIFQFQTLVQKNGILPPVVVEAEDLSSFSDDQMRTANKVYKIIKSERFVSVPPSWKDYLFMGLISTPNDIIGVKPDNSAELKIWRKSLQKGWNEGQEQAAEILKANFNRLTRDFTGMMLYSSLRQQNMVDSTKVGESIVTVTASNDQLMLGDKHKRILNKASFNTNPMDWKPTLNRPSDLDEGKVTYPKLLDKKVLDKE